MSSETFIRELWGKVPQVDCQNCGSCCGPVEMAQVEKQVITEYCKRHSIPLGDFFSGFETRFFAALLHQAGWQCPMRIDRKCRIYEVRPLICRLQGTTPLLPCPYAPNRKYPLGVTEVRCLISQSQVPHETVDAIDRSRSSNTSWKVEATGCGEGGKAAGQVVDLGFCPRCKDVIQPAHIEGYASRRVDGVLFCTLCAWHVERDSAELVKWVLYAKQGGSV